MRRPSSAGGWGSAAAVLPTLVAIAGAMALAVPAATAVMVGTTAAPTKEAMHAEMIAIAEQMRAIKADAAQAGLHAQLETHYQELSAALGGDHPAGALGGRTAAASSPGRLHARGGGVPLPPNCTGSGSTTDSTDVPVAIVDSAAVSSTLTVAAAGPFLLAIEISTSITHTFAGDLDFTIQSPSGTVVTLSTDNGGGNDNVFNGTTWDDDANPGGQVPYASNNGLVTDHTYANLVTATPLVPEETLGAFFGEDPNGVWTLTISDDAGGDVGSLDAWSVTITALDAAPLTAGGTFPSTDTPIAIVDVATISSTLAIAGLDSYLCDVHLTTDITHTFAGDLDFTLMSPAGIVVTLSTDNGAGNDNVFSGTFWDDDANPGGQVPYSSNDGLVTDSTYTNLVTETPLVPEEAFGAFLSEDPNGNWVVTISDDAGADVGNLNSWSLDLTTCTCQQPDADLEVTKSAAVNGTQIVWTISVTNNGPADATGVVVTDTLDACTVYISDDCGGANVPPWTWNIGALANGNSAVCNVTVDASGCGGAVSNTATASGDQNDPTPANNSDTASAAVAVIAIPTLDAMGLGILVLLLAGGALWLLRRRAAA